VRTCETHSPMTSIKLGSQICSGRGAPGKTTISSGNSGSRGTTTFYNQHLRIG
jgi:hypothetical protein